MCSWRLVDSKRLTYKMRAQLTPRLCTKTWTIRGPIETRLNGTLLSLSLTLTNRLTLSPEFQRRMYPSRRFISSILSNSYRTCNSPINKFDNRSILLLHKQANVNEECNKYRLDASRQVQVMYTENWKYSLRIRYSQYIPKTTLRSFNILDTWLYTELIYDRQIPYQTRRDIGRCVPDGCSIRKGWYTRYARNWCRKLRGPIETHLNGTLLSLSFGHTIATSIGYIYRILRLFVNKILRIHPDNHTSLFQHIRHRCSKP